MLETIREYAVERLAESCEGEALGRRHAEHFLTLAEEAYPHLTVSHKEWVDRLEVEHDNLRAALAWFEAAGESQRSLRLAGALWNFWYRRGHRGEARQHLERALGADQSPTAARARALIGAAAMAEGDTAMARAWGEEALALHRRLGDDWGIANSLLLLGNADATERDFKSARQFFEEALSRFCILGDKNYVMLATRRLAWMHYALGDRARARALHEEVVGRASATGNKRMQAMSLGALAEYALHEGLVQDSLPMLEKSTRSAATSATAPRS